ncbi:MAG: PepSY-like domain-containing protein [Tannerellaceae bacterium]|nr:PepSY-like domain-containing protein [Tannerellaceae bacterium]
MRKYFTGCLTVLLVSIFAIACNDEEKDYTITPTEKLSTALQQRFPEATNIQWESINEHYIASFTQNGIAYKAWFDEYALWYMTSYPISYTEIPELVMNTLSSSAYGNMVVKGVELVEQIDILYYRFNVSDSGANGYVNISGAGQVL